MSIGWLVVVWFWNPIKEASPNSPLGEMGSERGIEPHQREIETLQKTRLGFKNLGTVLWLVKLPPVTYLFQTSGLITPLFLRGGGTVWGG